MMTKMILFVMMGCSKALYRIKTLCRDLRNACAGIEDCTQTPYCHKETVKKVTSLSFRAHKRYSTLPIPNLTPHMS